MQLLWKKRFPFAEVDKPPTKGQLIEHFVSQWFAPSQFEPCDRCNDRAFVRRDLDEQCGAF
jgi:hypothetical protein